MQSRELIRHCSECIRAIQRSEWDDVEQKLKIVQARADELRAVINGYAELYHSGYTQDALKEVVEAHATFALVRGQPLPTPDGLMVENDTYLNGLAEAATELRRFIRRTLGLSPGERRRDHPYR